MANEVIVNNCTIYCCYFINISISISTTSINYYYSFIINYYYSTNSIIINCYN